MMKRNIFLFCLFFHALLFAQESEAGEPTFNLFFNNKVGWQEKAIFDNLYVQSADQKTISITSLFTIIDKIKLPDLNNDDIKKEASEIELKENKGIDIYGKIVDSDANIADINKRFKYQDRYYNIVEITSDNAQSLQAYFKNYNLPKGATLFLYDNEGEMILGAFTSNNNPKEMVQEGYSFMTQPVIGSKIYLELSYPIDSPEVPSLTLKSVVHGFKNFFNKGGAFGSSGDCNRNAVCNFGNGNNDLARNIKSVGLVLANYKKLSGGYTFSCSGTLVNNGKQDGTPYFLTAEHCVGASNTMNANWKNELLVLFNYETPNCDSNGSNAPSNVSNNSVLGCELLADSPKTWRDFALLKLNTTKEVLTRYKVCYAGWDNNISSYINTTTDRYSIHHPSGDAKKISLARHVYPTTANYTPLSVGDFLSVIFKTGVVEGGSSGGPLFNSQDKLIGSLSTSDNDLYCGSNNFYWMCGESVWDCAPAGYSRFSSNYPQMSAWLDPNNSLIQSIGPYCPSNDISIGAPIIVNPSGSTALTFDQAVDINRASVHPSQTFGKKIYVPIDQNNNNPLLKLSNDNVIATRLNLLDPVSGKLILSGIYKVVDCNKLQYIKDIEIQMKNPLSPGTNQNASVIGVGDNRVIVRLYNAVGNNYNEEVQSYKIVNKELVFEGWKTLFQNFIGHSDLKFYYENNRVVVIDHYQGVLYSWYNNNGNWVSGNSQTITPFIDIKMLDDKFFLSDMDYYSTGGSNKIRVYQFQANSPNYSLLKTFTNLYNSNNTPFNMYSSAWKVLNISKSNSNSNGFYINYIHKSQGDPFNRIVEIDLSNSSTNHLNLGGDYNLDFDVYGWTLYSSHIINGKIIQLRYKSQPSYQSPNYPIRIAVFAKNPAGVWTLEKAQTFFQDYDYAINDKYLLQYTVKSGVNILNIRELEYLFHPETIYDNSTINTAGYNMIKDLTHDSYWYGMSFGKEDYTNRILGNNNIFKAKHMNININSLDNKTIILSDFTKQIEGYKRVEAVAKYAIFMKPGFSVSSSTGAEFHAVPQMNITNANIPLCSFTFDDMLDPKLGQYFQQLYLRQGIRNPSSAHFGEIVYIAKDEVSLQNINYKIYPNPTKDILNIDLNGKHFKTLEVYSIEAKKIITLDISSKTMIEINMSQYPAGIYMVTLIDSNGKTFPNKVIKK
ncbi:T9SS type A sorting domain-containing protein [Chryseobacterium lathyri]|uniref:T9SS type A sorting domain-containing protein n=1 Tax=Chryseobacterium lathyri TaxID=395933 RepID=UPI001CBB0AE8|nr:T9SS type A sorting domain-containing protein [Chryseobacterium lathyri]